MATLLKVTASSTIKQLTPRLKVCNCLADALLGDAHCGPAQTLYVCSSRLAFGRRELVLLSMHPSSHKLPDRIIEHAQIWAPLWYDESLDTGRLLRSLSQARFEPRGVVVFEHEMLLLTWPCILERCFHWTSVHCRCHTTIPLLSVIVP